MPDSIRAIRARLAEGFRACGVGALWLASMIVVIADLVDPLRPESIRRPRAWAWRVLPVPSPAAPDAMSGPSEP